MLRDHVPSSWDFLVPNVISGSRVLTPEGKLAASKKGRGVHATGHRAWEKSCNNVGQILILRKMAFQQQWARFPGRHMCSSKGFSPASHSVPLGHMMALPLSASPEWDKKGREEVTKLAALSVSVSGLSLPCQRENLFIFKCSGSS